MTDASDDLGDILVFVFLNAERTASGELDALGDLLGGLGGGLRGTAPNVDAWDERSILEENKRRDAALII